MWQSWGPGSPVSTMERSQTAEGLGSPRVAGRRVTTGQRWSGPRAEMGIKEEEGPPRTQNLGPLPCAVLGAELERQCSLEGAYWARTPPGLGLMGQTLGSREFPVLGGITFEHGVSKERGEGSAGQPAPESAPTGHGSQASQPGRGWGSQHISSPHGEKPWGAHSPHLTRPAQLVTRDWLEPKPPAHPVPSPTSETCLSSSCLTRGQPQPGVTALPPAGTALRATSPALGLFVRST